MLSTALTEPHSICQPSSCRNCAPHVSPWSCSLFQFLLHADMPCKIENVRKHQDQCVGVLCIENYLDNAMNVQDTYNSLESTEAFWGAGGGFCWDQFEVSISESNYILGGWRQPVGRPRLIALRQRTWRFAISASPGWAGQAPLVGLILCLLYQYVDGWFSSWWDVLGGKRPHCLLFDCRTSCCSP